MFLWQTGSFRRTWFIRIEGSIFWKFKKKREDIISTALVFTFFMVFLNTQKCRRLFDLCILVYVLNVGIHTPQSVRCHIEFICNNTKTRKSALFSTVRIITQIHQILPVHYIRRYARTPYPGKSRTVDNFMMRIIIRGFHIGVATILKLVITIKVFFIFKKSCRCTYDFSWCNCPVNSFEFLS